ncbi:MAG: hypothetical protein J6D09_08625 [Clostridia bacterium]|nr:hypothetical protein [Clostridia bacterium]
MNQNDKKLNLRQNPQKRAVDQPINRPQNHRPNQPRQEQIPPIQNRSPQRPPINRQVQQRPQNAAKKPSGLTDNLRSQTPLQRQMRKKNAPSEPGTVRRTATQQFKIRQSGTKPQKQKVKKTSRSFTKRVLVLGVIAYLILLPMVVLIANLLLKSNVMTETDDFSYRLGTGKNTVSIKTYSYSRVCRDGVYYIDMDALADYCELTTTGDGKNMRYVVRETAESVEFVLGESIAYINGVPDRTGGNAFLYGGKVHIPLEFAKRCFINLDITLDTERNRITIVRNTDEKGNYLALDFPYKLTDGTDKIVFGELEVEIQEQIIKQNQPVIPEGDVTLPIQ